MKSLFIQLLDDVEILNCEKLTLMTGFVVQGHILQWKLPIHRQTSNQIIWYI